MVMKMMNDNISFCGILRFNKKIKDAHHVLEEAWHCAMPSDSFHALPLYHNYFHVIILYFQP